MLTGRLGSSVARARLQSMFRLSTRFWVLMSLVFVLNILPLYKDLSHLKVRFEHTRLEAISVGPKVLLPPTPTTLPPTPPPTTKVGTRFYENIETPAICFASIEWNCFTHQWGGLGRAFLGQASALLRDGEHPVRALFVRYKEGQRMPEMLCPRDADAEILAPFITGIDFDLPWFRGVSITYPPMLLLEWIRRHPKACRVLHVPDWNGFGVYVALAARAGLPEFRNLHVNVQVHGPQFLLSLDGLLEGQGMFDIMRDAQERLAIEHASSVTFLNKESYLDIKALSRVAPSVDIIPNILDPVPAWRPKQPPPMSRPIKVKPSWLVFYGKLSLRKGFTMFMKAITLIAQRNPGIFRERSIKVVVIGPMAMWHEEVTDLCKKFNLASGTVAEVHDNWSRWEVLDFFIDHARDAVAVLPSHFEVQSYALFDVMQSGAPFIASNISAHRAQVPETLHADVLVNGAENEYAERIKDIIVNHIEWQPMYYALPYDGLQKWRAWHKRIMSQAPRRPVLPLDVRALEDPSPQAGSLTVEPPPSLAASMGAALFPDPPLITVVVTVCDRITYLHLALLSVAEQTYDKARIHVLIAVACPGTFTCEAAMNTTAAAAAKLGNPVGCLSSTTSRTSLGRIRNLATAAARTDLVVYLDDDDEFPPDALANYVRAAVLNPTHSVFTSFADIFFEDGSKPIPSVITTKVWNARWSTLGSCPEAVFFINGIGSSSMMVNRTSWFWKASGGFTDMIGVGCEDWELLAKAALVEDVNLVPSRGLWYRKVMVRGQLLGMLAEQNTRDQHIACRYRVLRGALRFADQPNVHIHHYRLTSVVQYLLTAYERHEGDKF